MLLLFMGYFLAILPEKTVGIAALLAIEAALTVIVIALLGVLSQVEPWRQSKRLFAVPLATRLMVIASASKAETTS